MSSSFQMAKGNSQSVPNVNTQVRCKQGSIMYISVNKELLKRHIFARSAHTIRLALQFIISLLYHSVKTDSRRQLNNSLINTILFCAFYKKSSASKELHQTCFADPFVHLQKFCYWHASRMFAFWPGKLQILLGYSAIYFSNTIIASCSTILMREFKFEYERITLKHFL